MPSFGVHRPFIPTLSFFALFACLLCHTFVEGKVQRLTEDAQDLDKRKVYELKFKSRVLKQVQKMLDVMPEDQSDEWIRKFENLIQGDSVGSDLLDFIRKLSKAPYIPDEVLLHFQRLVVEEYHRNLWLFHARHFFDFEKVMSDAEMQYVLQCFFHAASEHFILARGKARLSYFSYSHKVKGKAVNSSRFAIGMVQNPWTVTPFVGPVLAQYNISFDEDGMVDCLLGGNPSEQGAMTPCGQGNIKFGGLGWDYEGGHIKVYARVTDLADLPISYRHLLTDETRDNPRGSEGILSWTYHMKDGSLHEKKVYSLRQTEVKLNGKSVPVNVTHLYANNRGMIEQYDVPASGSPNHMESVRYWSQRISEEGRRIMTLYNEEKGEMLDTIAYASPTDYALYFP